MIILGAKGFAFEVAEIVLENQLDATICFFDDINQYEQKSILNKYRLIQSLDELVNELNSKEATYTFGFGHPKRRYEMYQKLFSTKGKFTSTISASSKISKIETTIAEGCNILSGAIISNQVSIEKGCIIYFNAIITHGCQIGEFVEISPAAVLLGNCQIGAYTHIGAGAKILPHVVIGKNVVVGAGAVVCNDVPDNTVVVGVPAKFLKFNS